MEGDVHTAVLLAAGVGSRLGSLTAQVPKPLLPLRGKPVLVHNLEWCLRFGVREFYVNLHHQPAQIRAALGDGAQWGVRIT